LEVIVRRKMPISFLSAWITVVFLVVCIAFAQSILWDDEHASEEWDYTLDTLTTYGVTIC